MLEQEKLNLVFGFYVSFEDRKEHNIKIPKERGGKSEICHQYVKEK